MDLSAYSAFLTIAEHGSFSRAAEILHITQPAISKRIALLEQRLGAKLFDRVGRKAILNEAGKALLPVARKILQDVRESQRVIDNLSNHVSGQLSLVTSHHIGLRRLPGILKQFTRQYPQVRLDLSFMDSEEACQRIEKGDFELGVVTLPLNASRRLKMTTLWHDPLAIVSAIDHPLAALLKTAPKKKPSISLDQLAEHSAILPSVGTYTRSVIEQPILQGQLKEKPSLRNNQANSLPDKLDVILETNYLETIRMMVSIGLGWSALPKTMLGDDLVEIPVTGLTLSRTLGIVQNAERSLSNAAHAFVTTLKTAEQ